MTKTRTHNGTVLSLAALGLLALPVACGGEPDGGSTTVDIDDHLDAEDHRGGDTGGESGGDTGGESGGDTGGEAGGDDTACTAAQHCYLEGNVAHCDDGYTWADPASATDFTCIPIEEAGGCTEANHCWEYDGYARCFIGYDYADADGGDFTCVEVDAVQLAVSTKSLVFDCTAPTGPARLVLGDDNGQRFAFIEGVQGTWTSQGTWGVDYSVSVTAAGQTVSGLVPTIDPRPQETAVTSLVAAQSGTTCHLAGAVHRDEALNVYVGGFECPETYVAGSFIQRDLWLSANGELEIDEYIDVGFDEWTDSASGAWLPLDGDEVYLYTADAAFADNGWPMGRVVVNGEGMVIDGELCPWI